MKIQVYCDVTLGKYISTFQKNRRVFIFMVKQSSSVTMLKMKTA